MMAYHARAEVETSSTQGSSWIPANWKSLSGETWYPFRNSPMRSLINFSMEGSGSWQVQNFRDESDETGPYIAVALKFN